MKFVISYQTPDIDEYEFVPSTECIITKIDVREDYHNQNTQDVHIYFEYLGLDYEIELTMISVIIQDIINAVKQELARINMNIEEEYQNEK